MIDDLFLLLVWVAGILAGLLLFERIFLALHRHRARRRWQQRMDYLFRSKLH